jgi:hypothetical protein
VRLKIEAERLGVPHEGIFRRVVHALTAAWPVHAQAAD